MCLLVTFFAAPKSHDNNKLIVTIEAIKLVLTNSKKIGYNCREWK